LSAVVGRSVEARERRLVPEVIARFFLEAAPVAGLYPKPVAKDEPVYRIGRLPRTLLPVGDRLEAQHGRLAREYGKVVFDKALLARDATLEWVTPGHPLFEVVREDLRERAVAHLGQGAVFFDINRSTPSVLDVFGASIKDGRGQTLHRRLLVVETDAVGATTLRQPTVFLDIVPAPAPPPTAAASLPLPDRGVIEGFLYDRALQAWLDETTTERAREIERVTEHVRISLDALIDRQNLQLAELCNRQVQGQTTTGLDGLIAQAEHHLDELNNRRESRLRELAMEKHCTVADITHIGRALVVPHPERHSAAVAPMVRDDEVERTAVRVSREHEKSRGWVVEDVQSQNRGFDLISRRPHPEDDKTFLEVRFIEVKGRAGVGEIALTRNEYLTAERLKTEFWLYTVFNCGGTPELYTVQDPSRLTWDPVVTVEHYRTTALAVLGAAGAAS
jgi:hypothetical protein